MLALVALITGKTAIDTETVATVRLILDYELKMRELTDPIDADNQIAKLEEKTRRVLAHKGPLKARDLKKAVNAHRTGLWAFDRAIQNLVAAKEISQSTSGVWELVPSVLPSYPLHAASAQCS